MTRLKKGKDNGNNNGGALVPQPHGGGLRTGGTFGNAGGTGRPPSEVRVTSRKVFDERNPALANIADSDDTTATGRIRALDLLARVGLGGKTFSIEEIRERLIAQVKAIRERPGPEGEPPLDKLKKVWR